ncbi:hypothetical protein Alches_23120 [Alicyclobacillus hesperidum subsp. aegles]|uniref:hypothetical protein n=1 Tax=Alicyclobacillus hesperidum TaxID=89784 RepID=UPI00222C2FB1|nr:hypothetical protein [Alicyclobacillus hesperidum]GLG02271.1 hypothetical protein Alches_23120 [Alicyclobacillus hesperidum subsp. aegles]
MGKVEKRTQFRPYVPVWQKEIVTDIAAQRRLPVGDTARDIVIEASRHTAIISKLAPYFWRPLVRGDHIWPGHLDDQRNLSELIEYPYERCERLSLRMTTQERLLIDDIVMALAAPDAHAVAALFILGLHDERVVRAVAPMYRPRSRYAIDRRYGKWVSSIRR